MTLIAGQTYSSRSNRELNLASRSTHEHGKLVGNRLQNAQAVVVRKSLQEVLDDVPFIHIADVLSQLGDDLVLVASGEHGGMEDSVELGVLLEDSGERLEGFGGAVEGGGLCGGRVLRGKSELARMCD